MRKSQLRFGDEGKIHQRLNRAQMVTAEIQQRDPLGLKGLLKIHRLNWIFSQQGFHLLANGLIGRSPEVCFQLEAVEGGRIMAGRHHNSANRAVSLYREEIAGVGVGSRVSKT
jgi:hypothetical protein